MAKRITNYPLFSKIPLLKDPPGVQFPFNAKEVSFWYNARTAIWHGIRSLGLMTGDCVLVPAYSCGTEVDALLKADLRLRFYHVLPDLSPDFEHLEKLCKKPVKALFIIHYFGFPQPMVSIVSFARTHDLLLIEDNAHGLYSVDENGAPLGSFGDMSVFSIRKQLPLPDGGALVLGNGAGQIVSPPTPNAPGFREVTKGITVLAKREIGQRYPVIRRLKKGILAADSTANRPVSKERITFNIKRAAWRMSSLSRYILRRIDHNAIRERRCRNFKVVEVRFEGGKRVRPVKRPVAQGCCPWFYPVWAEDSEALERYLGSNGVACHRFWRWFAHPATPMEDFPFERALKYHVLGLPLHQDLDEDDMILIAETLNRWNLKNPYS